MNDATRNGHCAEALEKSDVPRPGLILKRPDFLSIQWTFVREEPMLCCELKFEGLVAPESVEDCYGRVVAGQL